jgi:hypothetical protein
MKKNLFLFFGVFVFSSFFYAQSISEVLWHSEILALEEQVYDLKETPHVRLVQLETYLQKIHTYLELFPRGSFRTPLKAIEETWNVWKTLSPHTLEALQLSFLPSSKGRPKPDLYLKCFVDDTLSFKTDVLKNKTIALFSTPVTLLFKAGQELRFEIWDKDLFKDDLLDTISFRSLCFQEFQTPLLSPLKKVELQITYSPQTPRLSHFSIDPLQTPFSQALALYQDFNYLEAFEGFETLAEQNYAPAQAKVGDCYLHGTGVNRQEAVALVWLKKALEQEQVDARTSLGILHLEGAIGVPKDEALGVQYLALSAEYGESEAQYQLAKLYLEGKAGLEKDHTLALNLLKKAAYAGHTGATHSLHLLEKKE